MVAYSSAFLRSWAVSCLQWTYDCQLSAPQIMSCVMSEVGLMIAYCSLTPCNYHHHIAWLPCMLMWGRHIYHPAIGNPIFLINYWSSPTTRPHQPLTGRPRVDTQPTVNVWDPSSTTSQSAHLSSSTRAVIPMWPPQTVRHT